jgi:hypothetical protein
VPTTTTTTAAITAITTITTTATKKQAQPLGLTRLGINLLIGMQHVEESALPQKLIATVW